MKDFTKEVVFINSFLKKDRPGANKWDSTQEAPLSPGMASVANAAPELSTGKEINVGI